jgi:hypothetical protein
MRFVSCLAALALLTGCSNEPAAPSAPAPAASPVPVDPQHQGMVGAHGDHSPHKGGMVLMNGDMHYEVVFARDGAHRIWFTDPVRAELPASVATNVTMVITRPGEPEEVLKLAIDDSGESWLASGRPVAGNDAYVKITYAMQGEPHEVEIPFLIQTPAP